MRVEGMIIKGTEYKSAVSPVPPRRTDEQLKRFNNN